jgi:hypothetical protein
MGGRTSRMLQVTAFVPSFLDKSHASFQRPEDSPRLYHDVLLCFRFCTSGV